MLPLAQSPDGLRRSRINDQLESAQALKREDLSRTYRRHGALQGFLFPGDLRTGGVEQLEHGAAFGTSDRLGVKPAVGRILVFGLAGRAHRKQGHRRARPVVGQPLNDRPPWPAVRAVARIPVRRSPGVRISWRQSGQVARSAGGWSGGVPAVDCCGFQTSSVPHPGTVFAYLDRIDPRRAAGRSRVLRNCSSLSEGPRLDADEQPVCTQPASPPAVAAL